MATGLAIGVQDLCDSPGTNLSASIDTREAIGPEILRLCTACWDVGSRATCDPPPAGTDRDVLLLCDDLSRLLSAAAACEFVIGGSVPADKFDVRKMASGFVSLKQFRGDLNLIVTKDRDFARRFMAATSVAKRLNLLDKGDRIALFQAVLYGNVEGPGGDFL